jgi:transposase
MKRRHELPVEQWLQIKPHLPGREGDPGRTGENRQLSVNAVLWIAKPGLPGTICRRDSVTGTPCSSDTTAGANAGSGSRCWRSWAGSPTRHICCWIAPLCGLTSMRLAQKGGAHRSARWFVRRMEHQNPRRGERARSTDPFLSDR